MTHPGVRPVGDDALAWPARDRDLRHGLAAALRASGLWLDVVAGKAEVTVQFDPLTLSPQEAARQLSAAAAGFAFAAPARPAPVRLTLLADAASAPDLAGLARENDMSEEDFLARLAASPLEVDMMGFMPGFAYVEGVDPGLRAGRLAAPRQKVAAGSAGLITGQLGLYALAGPGGWPLIGRIAEPLFDPLHEPGAARAFRLEPGMRLYLDIRR